MVNNMADLLVEESGNTQNLDSFEQQFHLKGYECKFVRSI